jgi:alpha,alpha-trehalase
MFHDYNWRLGRRSSFVSATAFYPLWAKMVEPERAKEMIPALLARLEAPGGILADDEASLKLVKAGKIPRQWDYPNGWAPHQMIAWQGLKNYGDTADMQRLVYKWLYTITKNAADFNGTVPEKFDVMKRSHAVFAEYGNVGTDFAYITQEGFGWMNASYQVGLAELPAALRKPLENLVPPENLKF